MVNCVNYLRYRMPALVNKKKMSRPFKKKFHMKANELYFHKLPRQVESFVQMKIIVSEVNLNLRKKAFPP